jgi:hypothetical protein
MRLIVVSQSWVSYYCKYTSLHEGNGGVGGGRQAALHMALSRA